MKIGLYIKDILYATGGTESYTVRMAQALLTIYPDSDICFVSECYEAKSEIDSESFVETLNLRYGTRLPKKGIYFEWIHGSNKNKFFSVLLRKRLVNASKLFDLFFYCSRGHYVFKARKNIAIIHFPMERLESSRKTNLISRKIMAYKDSLYANGYDFFMPNSNFTKSFLQKWWPEIPEEKIKLIYPPVIQISGSDCQKKNQIFICSRLEEDKNLESLIDAFKSSEFLSRNYTLVIAGGADNGSIYLTELIEYAKGGNIHILANEPFAGISKLYNESKFFWHSKGYGVDENIEPYKCEHFGITTVEAMSVGCIPVVINKAGQKEIVISDCGEKWLTLEELTQKTEYLAKNEDLHNKYVENCKKRASEFYLDKFTLHIKELLEKMMLI